MSDVNQLHQEYIGNFLKWPGASPGLLIKCPELIELLIKCPGLNLILHFYYIVLGLNYLY
jgi:hypothetical protein